MGRLMGMLVQLLVLLLFWALLVIYIIMIVAVEAFVTILLEIAHVLRDSVEPIVVSVNTTLALLIRIMLWRTHLGLLYFSFDLKSLYSVRHKYCRMLYAL